MKQTGKWKRQGAEMTPKFHSDTRSLDLASKVQGGEVQQIL